MAKKKKWLIMPILHSKFNDKTLETTLINKARELLTKEEGFVPSFIFLSGSFFDVKGFVYTGLRAWKGAVKPSASEEGRRPLLEATFASLSVYLSSLLAVQSDFYYAYDEIKEILLHSQAVIEAVLLWGPADQRFDSIRIPYGHPLNCRIPGCRREVSCEHLDQRALSCPIRPQQSEDLAPPY